MFDSFYDSFAMNRSSVSIRFHFLLHGQHHKYPMDPGRLVFPPVAASVLAGIFWLTYHSVLPNNVADVLLAGSF